jgi:hypothetical protein
MMGKVMTGRSFGGCVRYNLQKPDAILLDCQGLRADNMQTIIDDFNLQRKINAGLGKAVGHIALSWSVEDKRRLSSDNMAEVARLYMEQMGISDTQYLIVQHNDRPHPHLHIVYNRVDDFGKTISDQFQKERNAKVCKEKVNRESLNGADALKYELYDQITKAVGRAKNWHQLKQFLDKQGISTLFKYKSGTKEIQGVSFSKYDMQMKGSQIDRSLSYGNINKQLMLNNKPIRQEHTTTATPSLADQLRQKISERQSGSQKETYSPVLDIMQSMLDMAASITPEPEPYRKKRKNEENENRGISR